MVKYGNSNLYFGFVMKDLFGDMGERRKRPGSLHVNSMSDGTDSWITPPWVLKELGEFDLDPCVASDMPYDTARRMLGIGDDGLSHMWHGRVWLNPPYSNISPFMERMSEHGNGVALVFARMDTQWFHRYVFDGGAGGLFFFEGRIKFYRPSGVESRSNAGAPSVLIGYGDSNVDMLRKCNFRGRYVGL